MEKDVCMNCGECFIIDIQQDFGVGCKEKEEINCPHCQELQGTQMTAGKIITYKSKCE